MNDSISPFNNNRPLGCLHPPCPLARGGAAALRCGAQRSDTQPKDPVAVDGGPRNQVSAGAAVENAFNSAASADTDYRNQPIPPIDIEPGYAARLLRDPDYWLQEDHGAHGDRLLIRKTYTCIEGINEEGRVIALPAAIVAAAEYVLPTWIIEGVCTGDKFIATDLRLVDRLGFRSTPYWLRYAGLRELRPESHHLQIAETATKALAKTQLFERLRSGNRGFVFMKATAARVFEPSPQKAFSLRGSFGGSGAATKVNHH